MPVSLARRIKRIGLLPSTYEKGRRTQHMDPCVCDVTRANITQELRKAAKLRRQMAKGK